ncbi:MAG: hypothetical protein GF408_06200 [Candidatus Omnitrophica bacterium]|nr:hypothetical protein [Candidatus Omnitrophota bacterium]
MFLFPKITRANFLPASLIPFLAGAGFAHYRGYALYPLVLFLGLAGTAFAHLGANAINNYWDHKSGADGIGSGRSAFFGGSGLIARGQASPRRVLFWGKLLMALSFASGLALFLVVFDYRILLFMLAGGVLAVGYTAPPLKLAYRRGGEAVIFLLFGPLLSAGSFLIFTGMLGPEPFLVSLPIGFLVLAVILCNEVPDIKTDTEAGKKNLMTAAGRRKAWILYIVPVGMAACFTVLNVLYGLFPVSALVCLPFFILGYRAASLLRDLSGGFAEYNKASKLTVGLHTAAGIVIVLSFFFGGSCPKIS